MKFTKLTSVLKSIGIVLIFIILLLVLTAASLWYWSPRTDEKYGDCTTRWLGHGTFLISETSDSPLAPVLEKIDADYKSISSFEGHPGYCKDKKNIFFWGTPISGVDIESFSFLNQFESTFDSEYFTKDKNNVYAGYQKFPSADFDSFEEIGSGYYKDIDHIYYRDGSPEKEILVVDVDPKTFSLIGNGINDQ